MGKEVKTNAMRILDKNKIPYEILNYECGEFIDGLHTGRGDRRPGGTVLQDSGDAGKKQAILCIRYSHRGRGGLKSRPPEPSAKNP